MFAALTLLTCLELFDFLSKEICVRVSISQGIDSVQEPAEIRVDGERGSAWVNGKRVW